MESQLIIEIVIVALAVIAGLLYLVWQIKKKGLKEFAIDMILEAEEKIEQGRNSDKMKYVIASIKSFLATSKIGILLSIFVTDENIEKFIQEIFDGLKKALDYVPNKNESEE